MPEADPFADDPTCYFLDTLTPIPVAQAVVDKVGMYLLDLMAAQGYTVVSGLRVELVEPADGMPPYPAGWVLVRLMVFVQEFDVEVSADGG